MRHSPARRRLARRALAALFLPLLALAPTARTAHAQRAALEPAPLLARTFEIQPQAGLARQLDEGYRRHLDWHASAGDTWAWYLWQVTDGERAGLYVDGTFARAWSDFDHAVDPAGDAADNAVNVTPFATRPGNQLWRLRPDLGAGVVDPEGAPLVLRTEYRVRAGGDSAFVRALRRMRADVAPRSFAVFELVSGGPRPTYVVWAPASGWADAGAFAERAAAAERALATNAEATRTELWRFRADLSLCRGVAARCHATLGGGR